MALEGSGGPSDSDFTPLLGVAVSSSPDGLSHRYRCGPGDPLRRCGCCSTLPQTGWLTITQMSSLTVLEARRLPSGCGQGSGRARCWGEPSLHLAAAGSSGRPSAQGLHPSKLCLRVLRASRLCLSLLYMSLRRTLVLGFRAHLGNPGQSHFKIFNLTASTNTLFPISS